MKTKQKTLTSGDFKYSELKKSMAKNGFKPLKFGNRVPNGTQEKYVINIRRWCGEWTGWQTFKNVYTFYKSKKTTRKYYYNRVMQPQQNYVVGELLTDAEIKWLVDKFYGGCPPYTQKVRVKACDVYGSFGRRFIRGDYEIIAARKISQFQKNIKKI